MFRTRFKRRIRRLFSSKMRQLPLVPKAFQRRSLLVAAAMETLEQRQLLAVTCSVPTTNNISCSEGATSAADVIIVDVNAGNIRIRNNGTDITPSPAITPANIATITIDTKLLNDSINLSALNSTAVPTLNVNLLTTLTGGDGIDTINGSGRKDLIYGDDAAATLSGQDQLFGLEGNDTLNGGKSDDTLEGGAGDDSLAGGTGDDKYNFGAEADLGADTVTENTGAGDKLDFSNSGAGITIDLSSSSQQLVRGTSLSPTLKITLTTPATTPIEQVDGSAFGDNITGNSSANNIDAKDGDDVLRGAAGADTLQGGKGNDSYVFISGDGSDTLTENTSGTGGDRDLLDFTSSASGINIDLTSIAVQTTALSITITNPAYFEDVTGSAFADTLSGNAAQNRLTGLAGNDSLVGSTSDDTLEGGAGNDALVGGTGDDRYIFGVEATLGDDTLTEDTGNNDRLVFTSSISGITVDLNTTAQQLVRGTVGSPTLRLTLGTSAALVENVDGSAFADTIYGNGLANKIDGGAGNDTIDGRTSDDTLTGGSGSDQVTGDGGDDTYVFGAESDGGTDTLIETTGNHDKLDFTSSTAITLDLTNPNSQQVRGASLSLILGSDTAFEDVIGSPGADSITGNSNANILTGNDGNDILNGGTGEDTLYGGNNDDQLNGGDNDDSLLGEAGSDVLNGGKGEDTLVGGLNDDQLNGNTGDDVYLFGPEASLGSDTLTEQTGNEDVLDFSTSNVAVSVNLAQSTIQTPRAGLQITLGANYILFDGVVGSPFNDTIFGNDGNNLLTGGSGADDIRGGLGDDTYIFGTDSSGVSADLLTETGNDHHDALDFSDFAAGAAISLNINTVQDVSGVTRRIQLADSTLFEDVYGPKGNYNDNITGNASQNILQGRNGDDVISGLGANDRIMGGSGSDNLSGGTGNDTYEYENDDGSDQGDDSITETGADPHDSFDFTDFAYAISINLSLNTQQTVVVGPNPADPILKITLSSGTTFEDVYAAEGTYADAITGNSQANILDGRGGADVISGAVGNDVLIGGDDDDQLSGGNDNDTLIGGKGNDILNGDAGNDYLDGDNFSDPTPSANDLQSPADDPELNEGGGLVVGRNSANVLWIVEDHNNGPYLYANNTDGSTRGYYTLVGSGITLTNSDWEDMSFYQDGGTNYLYIADIGDNNLVRSSASNPVTIYRVTEPTLGAGNASGNLNVTQKLTLKYPSDIARDAEAFFIDPLSGDMYIVSKVESGGVTLAHLYRLAYSQIQWNNASAKLLEDLGALAIDANTRNDSPSGASISPNGMEILIKTDDTIYYYTRAATGLSIDELLTGTGTPPAAQEIANAKDTGNREAVAFDASGAGFYTISENDRETNNPRKINFYSRGSGNDQLNGGTENDILIAGLGVDVLNGDAGNDTADYSDRSAALSLTLDGLGNDGQSGEGDTIGITVENITGGAGGDLISGDSGPNILRGRDGSDTITGGSGNDTIFGDAAYDRIHGDDGDDSIHGGAGGDALFGDREAYGGVGAPGNDVIWGDEDNDDIIGGHWAITSNDGNDRMYGGSGSDRFYFYGGNQGNDTVTDDQQDIPIDTDWIIFSGWSNSITLHLDSAGTQQNLAGGGSITITTDNSIENVWAGDGDDYLYGDGRANYLDGQNGNDHIYGGGGSDALAGYYGYDYLSGDDGDDIMWPEYDGGEMYGGLGNDTYDFVMTYGYNYYVYEYVVAGTDNSSDTLDFSGTVGSVNFNLASTAYQSVASVMLKLSDGMGIENLYSTDWGGTIYGNARPNILKGGAGDDNIYGYDGSDELRGNDGSDHIYGGNGDDRAYGGAGNDFVYGEDGADNLYGDDGNDRLDAGQSDGDADNAHGGAGDDSLFTADAPDVWDSDVEHIL